MPVSTKGALREPQRERYRMCLIRTDISLSVRPEEPPSVGGVSKGVWRLWQ